MDSNGGNGTGAELRQERQDLSTALAAQEGAQVTVEAEQAASGSPTASNRGKQNRRPEGRSSVEAAAKDVLSDAEKLLGDKDNPCLLGKKTPEKVIASLQDGVDDVAEWLEVFRTAERRDKGKAASYLWGKIEALEDVVDDQVDREIPYHVNQRLKSHLQLVQGPDWKGDRLPADVITEAEAIVRDFEEHVTPFTVTFLARVIAADRPLWKAIKGGCEICHRPLTQEQIAKRFSCCSRRCNETRIARERTRERNEEEAFKAKILGRSGNATSSSSTKGGDVASQLGV